MVEAIQRGLNMPLPERRKRWKTLFDAIRRYDIMWWRDAYVDALLHSRDKGQPQASLKKVAS